MGGGVTELSSLQVHVSVLLMTSNDLSQTMFNIPSNSSFYIETKSMTSTETAQLLLPAF